MDLAAGTNVTDLGGRTSHTAIVARSLDIPAAVGVQNASELICQDDWIIVDGDAGLVIVDPSTIVLEEYRQPRYQVNKVGRDLVDERS